MARVEQELEPLPTVTLAEVQDRVCAYIDAEPDYLCNPSEREEILPDLKASIRSAPSIADIEQLLGADNFRAY